MPNDGTDDGEPLESDSITAINTAPTAPTVTVSPNPATMGEDLSCSVDVEGSDADEDDLSYTYVWSDRLQF